MRVFPAPYDTVIRTLQCAALFLERGDLEIIRQPHTCNFCVGQDNLRQRKRMNRADKNPPAWFDAECIKPLLKLSRALIVVRDAGHAAWLLHILR